jgi:ATP-dependent Lon protease
MIATLPIFPLPGIQLFPGAFLPLHIFEPRYRLMMDYCLENDDEIAVTSIKSNFEIEPVFGWGKIIQRDVLPDGRSNILIQGYGVAEIVRYKSQEPFIIASVEKRSNSFSHLQREEYREVLIEILRLTRKHLQYMEAEEEFIEELGKLRNHPFPVDIITSFLEFESSYKQEILACEDPYEKASKLLHNLMNLIKEQNS